MKGGGGKNHITDSKREEEKSSVKNLLDATGRRGKGGGAWASLPAFLCVPALLLGVGGAAEGLVHRLHDGVAVDAEDAQQLVGFAAAGHLVDGQALHGEARLVDHGRAHRLAKTAWVGGRGGGGGGGSRVGSSRSLQVPAPSASLNIHQPHGRLSSGSVM